MDYQYEHDPALPDGLWEPYKAFATTCMANGWSNYPGGVWGKQVRPLEYDEAVRKYRQSGERDTGDFTVLLLKADTSIWLVDRFAYGRSSPLRERYVHGWFAHGQHWIDSAELAGIIQSNVSYESIEYALDILRGYCKYCERSGQTLKALGFAGRICVDCDDDNPQIRKKIESPGWYN